MILREYQEEAKEEVKKSFLLKNKRTVCCLPTGSGKTVIGASVVSDSLFKGSNTCILVHRIEILKQFYKSLKAFGLDYINFIVSAQTRAQLTEEGYQGTFDKKLKQLNLCMVETFHRRYGPSYHDLPVDLYVMDEIHWGSYRKICNKTNFAHILGFSATPVCASNKDPLNTYFDDMVCPVSVKDLIDIGHLVRGRTFSIEHDFSNLKMRMGEFTESSQYEEFRKPVLFKGAVDNYLRYASNLRALCYNVNVAHSKSICDQFNKAGIPCAHVDGKTPSDERASIFGQYEHGDIRVLCNVGVATTGYDNPSTRCIIENRATAQLTLHHQMLGRGARPLTNPLVNPKNEFIIIDMGNNYARHGLYGEDVDWKELFHDPGKSVNKKEDRKLCECKECGAIVKVTIPKCPYCGYEKSPKEITESLNKLGILKEITDYKTQNVPVELRNKRFSEMTDDELRSYGSLMGYSPKWYYVIRNKIGRK